MALIGGTEGNDNLNGTEGPDTIEALGGNDVVEGGGGDDVIRGGAGYDVLWGGTGGDTIEAGDGGGEMFGEAGDDVLTGGTGADYITDGAGNDNVAGGAGDDVLRSSWYRRNDISVASSGSDTLDGGEGNDYILVHRENNRSGDVVRGIGGAGRDTIDMSSYGGINSFIADGGADDDVINFRSENADSFTASAGTGDDLVFFELLSGLATVSLGAGADTIRIGNFVSIRVGQAWIMVEDFQAGAAGDRLDFDGFVAAALTNWDQVSNPFGTGHLRLVESGADTILQIDRDGAGSAAGFVDLVTFRSVARAALLPDNLDGFDPSGAPTPGRTITGTEGPDTLSGTGGADTIDGLGGSDRIDGGGGDDTIRGGAGYDTLWGGIGADRIEAGDGGGEMFGEQGSDTLVGGSGDDVIWDGAGDDMLTGGIGNDQLRSAWYRRDEVSISATGSDTLDGGDGHDLLLVRRDMGTAGEVLTLLGGAGNDIIDASSGGRSRYVIDGGTGNDQILIRSEDVDSYAIAAGDGQDLVFVELAGAPVSIALGAGADTLRIGQQVALRIGGVAIAVDDFETGAAGDRLDFDVFLAGALIGWDGAANPFSTGHLQLVQSGADALLRIDRDAGGAAHGLVTLVTFRGAAASSFTLENMDGFAPSGGAVQGRTIIGTDGADSLNGTSGDDTIDALGGNDVVEGGGGDDLIRGGGGYDILWGGLGGDRIEAEGGGGFIYGESGDDSLAGGTGDDRIYDGHGNDAVTGGGGNDQLRSSTYFRDEMSHSSSGSDRLDGGEGDDIILIHRDGSTQGNILTAIGGAGADIVDIGSYGGRNAYHVEGGPDDDLVIFLSSSGEHFHVDAGTGADIVRVDYLTGAAAITLGAGADVLRIGQFHRDHLFTGSIVVADFQTGAGGDRLDFDVFLAEALIGWNGTASPFQAGYLRLEQSGADTLLEIDRDARAGGHGFVTLVTFSGTAASSFTASNLDGYAPVHAFAGTDQGETIDGTLGDDEIDARGGNDAVNGHGGDDRLIGGEGDDVLSGGDGNDFLFGHIGADIVAGGLGDDVYLIDAADTIVEHFGEGTDEVRTVGTIFVLGAGLDNLRGLNDGGHDFRGNAGPNAIIGAGGNDILRMQDGGDDLAFGKGGVDGFYFGAAFDQYDQIDGGENRDSLILQGNYSLTLRFAPTGGSSILGVESISLVSGANASFGDTANRRYSYDLTMIDANVAPGALMKVNGANLLAGENFTLDASDEKDAGLQIFAGLGTDRLTGGQQGDAFVFGEGRFAAGDSVTGGGGYDVLYLRGDYVIDFNAAGFTGSLSGVESIALLTSANTEFLAGGDGDFDYTITWNDAMLGAGGTMTANGGRLQAHETFVFNGASESDGHLRVFGGAGADTLTTGGGNDQIHGGAGADVLTGGGGADLYRYFSAGDSTVSAVDVIRGFVSGQDRIDLSRVDAKTATPDVDDAFAFIGSATFTAAGQLRAVNVSDGLWHVEADVNGDGVADFLVQVHVSAGESLTAADFVV